MAGNETRDKRETVRFTPTEHAQLLERARIEDRSKTDMIRILALAELRRRNDWDDTARLTQALLRDPRVDLTRLVAGILRARPGLAEEVAEALQKPNDGVAQ